MNGNGIALLAESLTRVEHKLDLILKRILGEEEFEKMDHMFLSCPVCKTDVKYCIDFLNGGVVNRVCECGTGLVPFNVNLFSPGVTTDGGKNSEEDDREDPDSD